MTYLDDGGLGAPFRVVEVQVLGPDRDRLLRMCRRLVGDELIACGQVEGPVTSVYRWRNEVHEVTEWRARLKTVPAAVHEVTHRLYEDHPDELPEITVLPYIGGLTPYVEWVEQSVDAVPDSDWAQG